MDILIRPCGDGYMASDDETGFTGFGYTVAQAIGQLVHEAYLNSDGSVTINDISSIEE